jgi:hypothetical protein
MFSTWLNNQPKSMIGLIWVGTTVLCWAIWRCRNDVIFKKLKTNSIMQVIFRGAHWLRSWTQLQRDEQAKDTLTLPSKKLEVMALEISNRGWKHLFALVLVSFQDFGLLFFFQMLVCNDGLCTSMDVVAGFCNPLSKKIKYESTARIYLGDPKMHQHLFFSSTPSL